MFTKCHNYKYTIIYSIVICYIGGIFMYVKGLEQYNKLMEKIFLEKGIKKEYKKDKQSE